MNSLVGDYTDSDEEDDVNEQNYTLSVSISDKEKNPSAAIDARPTRDFGDLEDLYEAEDQSKIGDDGSLIEDDDEYFVNRTRTQHLNPLPADSSDDSSSDESFGARSKSESQKPTCEITLENPFRSFGTAIAEVSKSDSVFQIQFLEDEQQKSEALQKHVKMTSAPGGNAKINGKKVCWNFRKGKCRFGHNCTYGHDSDLLVTKKASGIGAEVGSTKPFTIQKAPVKVEPQHEFDSTMVITSTKKKEKVEKLSDDEDAVDDYKSDNLKGKKKRKRPGLTQNLTPGKKVMKEYFKNKTS